MTQFKLSAGPQANDSRHTRRSVAPERWNEFWRQIVQDQWYQDSLACCARVALRKAHRPYEWLADLKNDAMLLLARQLMHLLDRPNARFEIPSRGWLLVAMRGHCREALHRMIAATRHCRSFLDEEDFAAPAEEPASRFDLRGAIASLDEPQRSILGRQAAGDSLHEIARDQRLTYWQVWRLSRRGIEQLRAKLSP